MQIKVVYEKAAQLSFGLAVIIGTLSPMTFIQADDECCPTDNCPQDNCTVEYVPYQPSTRTTNSCLPGCCKKVSNFMDEWGIRLDSLWWQANAEGNALGKEVLVERTGFDPVSGNYENVVRESHLKKPKLHYDSGFRFAISHQLPCCSYDLMFEWTHFYTTGHATGNSIIDPSVPDYNQYTAFVPYWETLAQNYPNHAKGHWKFDLNLYDLVIGKHLDITSCFTLRPYVGLRCAWIDQKYKVRSFADRSADFAFNGSSYSYQSEVHAKNDFIGVGPRLGCAAEVELYCGFSLIGNAAGSLVYGKFDRSSKEHFTNADHFYYKFNEFTNFDHKDDQDGRSRAITDLSVGLKWDYDLAFRSYRFPITIALSWEHHAFYDFNNFNNDANSFMSNNTAGFDFGPDANLLPSGRKYGDIYTQGFTLSTHIGF